jgi:hypothetical protein
LPDDVIGALLLKGLVEIDSIPIGRLLSRTDHEPPMNADDDESLSAFIGVYRRLKNSSHLSRRA